MLGKIKSLFTKKEETKIEKVVEEVKTILPMSQNTRVIHGLKHLEVGNRFIELTHEGKEVTKEVIKKEIINGLTLLYSVEVENG